MDEQRIQKRTKYSANSYSLYLFSQQKRASNVVSCFFLLRKKKDKKHVFCPKLCGKSYFVQSIRVQGFWFRLKNLESEA